MKIMVVNGPNMNLLGQREPEKYGYQTLDQVQDQLGILGRELGLELVFFQSNHEGDLVEAIQRAGREFDGVVLNAAAYTHTSVALRDAVMAVAAPVVEVHMTHPSAREEFRHRSYLAGVCAGSIMGFGVESYELALWWFYRRTTISGVAYA